MASASAPSSAANGSAARYSSMSSRCSSRLSTLSPSLAPGALELGLDLSCDVGELGEDVNRGFGVLRRLEARARPLEPVEQLLRPSQRALAFAHAALSRAIRPRMPFTRRPASSDA